MKIVAGIILHYILAVIIMWVTGMHALPAGIVAGCVVWLGILLVTEDMFG